VVLWHLTIWDLVFPPLTRLSFRTPAPARCMDSFIHKLRFAESEACLFSLTLCLRFKQSFSRLRRRSMVHLRVAIPAVGAVAMLLSNAALHAQTFTWGPVHSINLPVPAAFSSLPALDMNNDGNADICLLMWTLDSSNARLDFNAIYVGDGLG